MEKSKDNIILGLHKIVIDHVKVKKVMYEVRTIRFCSNFISIYGPNTYQIMYGEMTSDVSISNGNIKYSIGKSILI